MEPPFKGLHPLNTTMEANCVNPMPYIATNINWCQKRFIGMNLDISDYV